MSKNIIIKGADFSANAIPVAKAVDGTPSSQYVYVANVNKPSGSFDWDSHKIEITIHDDGYITSLNLPDDTIGVPRLFQGGNEDNSWLREIDLSYLSGFHLTSLYTTLRACINLKRLVIDGNFLHLNGQNAVAYMLYNCSGLDEIIIEDTFNAPILSDISYIFDGTSVSYINGIENLITSNVTKMEYIFNQSLNIERIDGISKCDTSNVTSFLGTFNDCGTFGKIDISNWHIAANAVTKYMFKDARIRELNANCFTALYGDITQMFYMNGWNTIHLDNLNDVSAVTSSDNFFSNTVSGTPKVTIANVTNEAVKTFLKSKLNAVSAGGSSDWQEATVGGVLCLVP